MTETTERAAPPPIPADQANYLISMAARAPSVHNSQPWRFRVGPDAIELHADPARKLRTDPLGREMLISCGAALFGLRLAVRSLGRLPVTEMFPEPARLRLLARVTLGENQPVTEAERQLLAALPHRHTHRGPFDDGPLPAGLLAQLQHDALTEGAILVAVQPPLAYHRLADIVGAVSRRQDADPAAQAEIRRWTRVSGAADRDGVPALAFTTTTQSSRGRLRQRDFDQGRELGGVADGGPPAAVTAVLVTPGDGRADWVRAGQALHRILTHAAASWVFASLFTQPLTATRIRDLIRDRLSLPGAPQMLLQLGRARTAHATARRPATELIIP